MTSELLPVDGFVLAGGASTRMGTDKALLAFRGRPLVAIAVEKLRGFCTHTYIAGNRDDLARYAPVAHETRLGVGPAAGIEAGLHAATSPWALFVPVDVPLVPAELLRVWVEDTVLAGPAAGNGSFLVAAGEPQPAFCLLRSSCKDHWSRVLATGQQRLAVLLAEVLTAGSTDPANAGQQGREVEGYLSPEVATSAPVRRLFCNLNTPQQLAEAAGAVQESALTGPLRSTKRSSIRTDGGRGFPPNWSGTEPNE